MQSTVRNISSTIWDKDIPAIVAGFRVKVQGLVNIDTISKKAAPAILMRIM